MSVPTGQNLKQYERWFRTAEADLQAARWSRDGKFYHTACFQAQQAAEKGIKALLLSYGKRNVQSHSTVELLNRSLELHPSLGNLMADCRILDRHYIPTRYPDALPDGTPEDAFGLEDADDAILRSERILTAIENIIADILREAIEKNKDDL